MPAPRRKKTPKPEATASSSMDMHQLLNDIEGMKEAGAVARLAALRFKLPGELNFSVISGAVHS